MLGEILKMNRSERGLTQQQVADELHVSRQTLSNWENGKNYPDIPMLIELSEYYSLSLDYMLKGDASYMNQIKKNTDDIKQVSILKPYVLGITFLSIISGIIQRDIYTTFSMFFVTIILIIVAKLVLFKPRIWQIVSIAAVSLILGVVFFLLLKSITSVYILSLLIFVGEIFVVLHLEKKLKIVKNNIVL